MRSRISYRSTGIILILARLLVQVLSDELTPSEEHGFYNFNDTKYQNSVEEPAIRLFDRNTLWKSIHGNSNIMFRGQMEHNDTKHQNSVEEPEIRIFDHNMLSSPIKLRSQMEHNDTKYQNSVEEPATRLFDRNMTLKNIDGNSNIMFRGQMEHNDTEYQNSVEEPEIRLFDRNALWKSIHGNSNIMFRGQMEHNDTKYQNSMEEPATRLFDHNMTLKNIDGNSNIIFRGQMEHNDTKYQNSVEEPEIRIFDHNMLSSPIKLRSQMEHNDTKYQNSVEEPATRLFDDNMTLKNIHGNSNIMLRGQMEHNDTKYQNSVEEPEIRIFDRNMLSSPIKLRSQMEHNDTKYQNSVEEPAIRLFDRNALWKSIHGNSNIMFRGQMEHNDTKYQNSVEEPATRLFDDNMTLQNIHGNSNIMLRGQMEHNDTKYQNSVEEPAIRLFDRNALWKSIHGNSNIMFRGQMEHNDTKYQNSVEEPEIRLIDDNKISTNIKLLSQMEHNDTKYQNSAEEPAIRLFDRNALWKSIHGNSNIMFRGQMEHNDTKYQNSAEEPAIRFLNGNSIWTVIKLRSQMENNDTKYQNSAEEPAIRFLNGNSIWTVIKLRSEMEHNDTKYQNSVEEPEIRIFDHNMLSSPIKLRSQMEHNDTKYQNSAEEPATRLFDHNDIWKNIIGNNNIMFRAQIERNDRKYPNSAEEPATRLFDDNMTLKNIDGNSNIIFRGQIEHIDKLMPAPGRNTNEDAVEDELTMKLCAAVIFRENILRVFGHVLYASENKISESEYSSLYMIHEALRRNLVFVFNMLPIMHKIQGHTKIVQWEVILVELIKTLPPYLESTAEFLLQQIYGKKFNPQVFFPPGVQGLPDFLDHLNLKLINHWKIISDTDEIKSYDKSSEGTKNILGPAFADVLHKIITGKINFTQRLFAAILMSLPQNGGDPIFDENIRYIYELSKFELIPFPKNARLHPEGTDLYELINSTISKILTRHNIPIFVRESLFYISNHLSPITVTYMNPMHNPMKRIVSNRFKVNLLLSSIVLYDFSPDAVHLRDRLLYFIRKGYIDMKIVLDGMNIFIYNNPMDLLIAILTRMQKKIRPSYIEIHQTISALLSTLLLKKEMSIFRPNISPSIDITTILGYLQNPALNNRLLKEADSLHVYILNHPEEFNNLNTLIPLEKKQCALPRQCIVNAVSDINSITSRITYEKVKRLQLIITKSLDIWKDACLNDSLGGNKSDNGIPEKISPENDPLKNPLIDYIYDAPGPPVVVGITEAITINTNPATPATITNSQENPAITITSTEAPGTTKPFKLDRRCCLLPSGVRPNASIYVRLNNKEIPWGVSTNKKALQPSKKIVTLPSIMFLMSAPNTEKLLVEWGPHFKKAILDPLKSIYGVDYLIKIFKTNLRIEYYPTNVALVLALLEKALMLREGSTNMKLNLAIEKYIQIINYVSIVLLMPIVSQYNHIKSMVVYSIVNDKEPMLNHILEKSPKSLLQGSACFPLWHPEYYLLAVDQENPYVGLLPDVSSDSQCIKYILILKQFLATEKINKVIGPHFNPLLYPNRGTLLCEILKAFGKLSYVQMDVKLRYTVTGYLQALRLWVMYTYVPSSFILSFPAYGTNEVPSADWKPDLSSLMIMLPPARTHTELKTREQIQAVLSKENLLDMIGIPKPATDTNRSVLLIQIIKALLNSKNVSVSTILRPVLKSYVKILKTKSIFDGTISWSYSPSVKTYMADMNLNFHKLLSNCFVYNQLPFTAKTAYKIVSVYFTKRPEFLRNLPHFGLLTKRTQGVYLRRLFVYLILDNKINHYLQRKIRILIPYIRLKASHSKIKLM